MDSRELEWQFDAFDLRPVVRWLNERNEEAENGAHTIKPTGSTSQLDIYFDTEDRRFHRAGYALRVRRSGRGKHAGVEATLKELGEPATVDPSLRGRREVSETLKEADLRALMESEGPVGSRVRAVAGKKVVRPLFEVRTRRRSFSVEAEGSPPGEIAIDETAIRPAAGGQATRLHRVEVEAPEATFAALRPFVEQLRTECRLQPAGLTKYEAGVLAAGLTSPSDSFGPVEIEPDASIGRVALAVLRRQFAALLAKEPGTRLGDDTEELHDMRVASRRLRAALSLFEEFLPPSAAKLADDLMWLGQTLGAVRDLDVQLEQLNWWLMGATAEDSDAVSAVRLLLEAKRTEASEAMLTALDSRRYELFVSRFGRLLRSARGRRSGPASMPARAVVPDLIEERFRAFRRAARRIEGDSPPAEYHRVRIRGKRLRYALEFLADLYPGQTGPLTKRLTSLQDLLGLHQDAEVAIKRLRRLACEHGADLPPEAIFAMGEIAEHYRQNAVELRARFPKSYSRVAGKPWKTFARLIETERPERPAAPAKAVPVAPANG